MVYITLSLKIYTQNSQKPDKIKVFEFFFSFDNGTSVS